MEQQKYEDFEEEIELTDSENENYLAGINEEDKADEEL